MEGEAGLLVGELARKGYGLGEVEGQPVTAIVACDGFESIFGIVCQLLYIAYPLPALSRQGFDTQKAREWHVLLTCRSRWR